VVKLFEDGLADGRVSLDDLFDERYTPIRGSDPEQFMTRSTLFTDAVLPPLFEPLKVADHQLRYAVATDRNGYIGTHNLSVSHPQGADPTWNDANCRNRRFFKGRTELAAARNTEPFLLQAYRRPMGGGKHALMKDIGVPVTIRGRHWGAVRIGYVSGP
jgi:methyl-accepting chemotaxis protein